MGHAVPGNSVDCVDKSEYSGSDVGFIALIGAGEV